MSTKAFADFSEMVQKATDFKPYDYQKKLADDGPVELLAVPTGAGKTLAAVLPWVYRRRFHPDPEVRKNTPRRLVYALPMRTLVEQGRDVIETWLKNENLGLDNPDTGIGTYILMGGESREQDQWRLAPHKDAIIIGTIDMLLSRALNRGFGESTWSWPISFGLLNNDCHWVFDEIQLMGPSLPTSRQLHGLRQKLSTAKNCSSTWMSATVNEEELKTVDCPDITSELRIDNYLEPRIEKCLTATKLVSLLGEAPEKEKEYVKWFAGEIIQKHEQGSLTLVFVNMVKRAQDTKKEVQKILRAEGGDAADLLLIHSRFRPPDRKKVVEKMLEMAKSEEGGIIISTQVLEAGVDISAKTLITELASWSSIVQRLGRCNRKAENNNNANVFWITPPKISPYEEGDIESAKEALKELEGQLVTPKSLQEKSEYVLSVPQVYLTLRRKDLLDLFDTAADLSGGRVDVSPYIRESDSRDCQVAWRENPDELQDMPRFIQRDERCGVPIGEVQKFLEKKRGYIFDNLGLGWHLVKKNEVRPGMVVVLNINDGGYTSEDGWQGTASNQQVEPNYDENLQPPEISVDQDVSDDPESSVGTKSVTLCEHLKKVKREAETLVAGLGDSWQITDEEKEAIELAAALHDLGKAHPSFQAVMREGNKPKESKEKNATEEYQKDEEPLWAKSSRNLYLWERRKLEKQNPEVRRGFRHEFASALALREGAFPALASHSEIDLIVYLVAAHHGRVRLGVRSLSWEKDGTVLGVKEGDELPSVATPEGESPEIKLSMKNTLRMGEDSWSEMALNVLDNLGPFKLAYLEALVRMADWRASADEQGELEI